MTFVPSMSRVKAASGEDPKAHMCRPPLIGIIGGENPPEEARDLSERVGELVAKRGGVVVCGGLGGVMESVCKGASRAGGLTIGILPSTDREDANRYVTIPIVTAMSTARNAIIVRTAEVLIAIDGSYGTLTEISYALDLKKRIVLLGSWPVVKMGVSKDLFLEASTPEEAVDLAFGALAAEGR